MNDDYRQIYKDHYGIEFTSDYDVHHIDLNRSNNSIDNLVLLPARLHHQYHFALSNLNAMADEEGYPKHLCMFSGLIRDSASSSYMIGALQRFKDAFEECVKWYEFKQMLDGFPVADRHLNTAGITIKEVWNEQRELHGYTGLDD